MECLSMKVGWKFALMKFGELSAGGHMIVIITITIGILEMQELFVVSLDIKN